MIPIKHFDEKETMEIENPIEEVGEGSRDLSTQEIIDGLEELIKTIESVTNEKIIEALKKAVILILKILSVEYNKQIDYDFPQTSRYIS